MKTNHKIVLLAALSTGLVLSNPFGPVRAEVQPPFYTLDLSDRDVVERQIGPLGQWTRYLSREVVDGCYAEFDWANSPDGFPHSRDCSIWLMGSILSDVEVTVRGTGMIEVGFALTIPAGDVPEFPHRDELPSLFTLEVAQSTGGVERVWTYPLSGQHRDLVISPPESHEWTLRVILDQPRVWDWMEEDHANNDLESSYRLIDTLAAIGIKAVARRIDGVCVMAANVSGDINQHFFGDAAYFNTATIPVKRGMMVGTIGETQTHESVAGFGTVEADAAGALDLAAQFGLIDEDEQNEAMESLEQATAGADQSAPAAGDGFSEWVQRELAAEDPAQGDNFGLNLVDVKAGVTPSNEGFAGAMMAGAFTFTLSGRLNISEFDTGPTLEGAPRMIEVTPSTISATVGVSDQGGDRIPFELPEDGAMAGAIAVSRQDPDYIIGRLGVELETRGVYNLEGVVRRGTGVVAKDAPRKLKIGVVATFAARRGSLSCMQ